MSSIISLSNVNKRFGKNLVLNGIDLEVKSGEIFGLLGVNGAGKTTLMRSLLGLLKINDGSSKFKGQPITPRDIKNHFGFLPESFLPPRNLKAFEFLNILGKGLNRNRKDVESLLDRVGLSQHKKKPIRAFSRGMIQRLGLATCLLKNPEVIILDEPTLGLDPVGQKSILAILKDLNQQGKTIFFSSHILTQMEELCSRISIIHSGKISFVGTVSEAMNKHKVSSLEEAFLKEVGAQ